MGISEFRSHIRAGQEWHHTENSDDPCRMLAVLQEVSSDHIAAYMCSRLLRLDPRCDMCDACLQLALRAASEILFQYLVIIDW